MMDEVVDLSKKYDFDALCVDDACPVPGPHGAGLEGCIYLIGSAQGNIKRVNPDVEPDDWSTYLEEFAKYAGATGNMPGVTPTWSDFEWRDDYQFWVLNGKPTNWAHGEKL